MYGIINLLESRMQKLKFFAQEAPQKHSQYLTICMDPCHNFCETLGCSNPHGDATCLELLQILQPRKDWVDAIMLPPMLVDMSETTFLDNTKGLHF